MTADADKQNWKPAVCTQCSCLCDDVRVRIEGNRIADVQNGCPLADPWFRQAGDGSSSRPLVEGSPATWDEALQRAAQLFRSSRAPLICGLNRFGTDDLRAAVELADRVGAVIDPDFSESRAAATVALQSAGQSTSTLGEVRRRADVVIFWLADPMTSHPRFIERFVSPDREKRTVIVVDTHLTATARMADRFIRIPADGDLEILTALRGRLSGKPLRTASVAGIPADPWNDLVATLHQARYGALFWGADLATGAVPHRAVEAVLRLVVELNAETRFVCRGLRSAGTAGAENVLAWQTGFPQAVSLARGIPRYEPDDFSALQRLRRRSVDLVLIGDESPLTDPRCDFAAWCEGIPTVVLGTGQDSLPLVPTVRMPCATVGLDAAGTVYRMDEVALPVPKLLDSPLPSAAVILRKLVEFSEKR